MPKVFAEYGLDFDNNRYGFGRSIEIENEDGSERRVKHAVPMVPVRRYVRLWVGRRVFILSVTGLKIARKTRRNFKCVFGIEGHPK
ncbi:MAG: DUF3977 domain-containing protein [Alphaproteobacteria bacterium]|nr:DUF3977 domain-containing protein [Alphaproteobacteria bacterium]